jgi:hypothetical protein
MMRAVFFSPPAPGAPCLPAQRFRCFPLSSQLAILFTLRQRAGAEESLAQVPATEWLRLLRLVDPLIQLPTNTAQAYRVTEGRHLLRLLLQHYLDVL